MQARFIERLKRRGREYADVQRRASHLLHATSALSTSSHTSFRPTATAGSVAASVAAVRLTQHKQQKQKQQTYSAEEDNNGGSGSSGGQPQERLYYISTTPNSGGKKAPHSTPGSGKKNVNFVRR